jgi:lipopolysaccharide export system protein LptA
MKPRAEAILPAPLALILIVIAGLLAPAGAARAQDNTVTAAATTTTPAAGATNGNANSNASLSATKAELTRMPSAAKLRPTGPVTIKSNSSEMEQNNFAVYTGNVILDSDTLKMDGDRLELKRAADGQYTIKVTGTLVHMSHPSTGVDDPPLTAHAKTVTYDSRTTVVDLVGDAMMTHGEDTTTADTIHYNMTEQRYEASGGNTANGGSGRVTVVIPQAPVPGAAADGTAAPAPQPAPLPPKP